MIVRVYNFLSEEKPKFSQNLVGIVSDVTNFKYTRRAYDIGSFEMTIPTHADETECIQPDRMLIVGEKIKQTYIDGDPTKRIVVGTFLYVTDVEKKDDTITVTGYDLKYLFALRVTLFPKEEQDKGTYGYYVTSGTTFSCISDIINYNIVNTTDSDRQIYGMFGITMPVNQINADPPLTGIQDDRYMTRLEPVSTAIFNLLKNCKTHFYDMRLIIDDNAEDGDNYNPHMESSEDKPTIIIDESRYNIKSYTRKDGTSAYKNAIYAVVGSGDAVTVKCVKRPDDTASGVKRKEVVLDVDTDSVAEIDRYALKAAEEYVISDDFEIEPLFMDDETEPELAQKVSIRIDGVEYNTVITEITNEYANGKHTQSYVCGDKKLKVLNVLNKATAGNTQKIVNNKIAMGNKTGVGVFVNYDRNSEIFNDYNRNTASGRYSHVEGYKNNLKSEGAAWSWATHIEGQENTEASRTSCPSDKKASNNHIEGKLNSSYGRINHVEGVNCFAEYDTQCCHVEGSNSRAFEGAKVAHAEGKDCVAGNECSHAEGKSAQATGYVSHAEGGSCTANGNYSHAEGLSSEASGKCSHAEGEVNIASGNHSHAEGWSNIASGECSHASGKDNTASGDFSIASGGGSEATGTYAIAHGLACTAGDNSVAIGTRVQAANGCVAFGKYNKTTDALFVIGSGTSTSDGKIKAADALVIDHDGNLHIPGKVTADGGVEEIASSTKAGIVKISRDFEISEDGTLSIVKGGTFPPATQTTLGGVIVGQGFSVSDDGFLTLLLSHSLTINKWHQIDVYGASNTSAGIVKIGSGITAEYQRNEDTGMLITKISVQPATAQEAGIVKVGEGLSVEADGTLNADIYPPASLFLSGASKMMLHKYIPVESKKQGYYYGSVASDIICDTVKYCSSVPEFPESYIVIPNWYSSASASATVTSNAAFELTKPTINNDESTFTVKVVCKELNFSSSVYSATNFYNTTIYLKWNNIKEPTDKFPNGYITCEVRLYYCDTSGTPQDRRVRSGYIPFASKAEYNAAICLTATELSTFDLSEENYTLLVPNSLCLLSGELPNASSAEEGVLYLIPNEDNTAAKQYMWNGTEYKYFGETDHSVDLSEYLKSTDISDWAKAGNKPAYTAEEIGLGNVDNTADADKPISSAMQTALDGKADMSHKHTISDITDMPASLPASGGNADTVDGKHANAFYPAKANFALGLDYNSLTSNGIFELLGNESNPTKNAPNGNDASNNFYVQVFVHSTAFLTQIATSVRSDKTQYIRSMSNGTWNAWGKIKSGDADTVDGKHASDFAVAGHTHTAADVGAAAKSHTHTKSQITDFPTLGTAAGKNIDYFATASHKHTAAEIGAATAANITAAVNAVSIGGRNIVTGSATLTIGTGKRAKGHWRTSGSSGNGEILGTFRESMPSCGEITAISIECHTSGTEYGIAQDRVPLDKDSYYTLSCWVRSGSSDNARCALQPFWKSSTDSGGRKYFVVGASWQRLSFTSAKKPATTDIYSAGYVLATPNDDYPEPTISVCGIKLEKGNKPTDWTPAPEDAERRITSLEARVAALEAAAVSGGEV